jgi:signal transduction histidine kinase
MKDYESAKQFFRKSIQTLKTENRPFALASIYNNLGLAYSMERKRDSASFYFNKAIEKLDIADAKKEGFVKNSYNDHFKNIIKSNIAYLAIYDEKYDKAITAIKREAETAINVNEVLTEAQAYKKLSYLYYKKRNYKKALEYLNLLKSKLRSGTDNGLRIEALEIEAKLLLASGKQKLSEKKYEESRRYRDSITSLSTKKSARIASVLYDVKKKDMEIKTQQANIALLDSQNRRKQQLLLFGGVGLFSVFGFVLLFRSRNSARNKQKLQEEFSQGLLQAQENERSRLAFELHDSVGQQLMMITRKSKSANDETLEQLASSTLSNLRAISRNLHPALLEQLGLSLAITHLIDKIDEDTDSLFARTINNVDDYFKPTEALHIYRIVQELITNVIKHAEAKSVEILLLKKSNSVKLVVKDSGKGFETKNKYNTGNSLGMKSIEERCKILKAKLNIVSKPNVGTKISAEIPIRYE